jgi:Putative S-adenosyl-L-methionine-dependent methyltransferase
MDDDGEDDAGFVLEEGQRLSRSLLWTLQRAFYQQQGIDAWRRGTVPLYVTSNPFIAGAYARVVLGFLEDCRAASWDADRPVHVIELGAGSGRFACHFLKKLLSLHERSPARLPKIRYVMTDFVEANLATWQGHPSLQPFVEQGVLDFARFDVEEDREMTLVHAGVTLSADRPAGPLAAIANYFFDSIPSDAFLVQAGRLHESLVTVTSSEDEPDRGDPGILARAELRYEHRLAAPGYYGDPELDAILRGYEERLAGGGLRFPIAALSCCRLLAAIAGGRLLLLSGDKGQVREDALLDDEALGIAVHGSFSTNVNYHAVAELFRRRGGRALHAPQRHANLLVMAFLLGDHPGDHAETRRAFEDAVAGFGPDEFFSMKKGIEKGYGSLSLAELLAFLRLSGCDGRIMGQCLPALTARAREASEREKKEVYRIVQATWDTYYHLGEELDLPFSLGMLLYEMGYHEEALLFFERSIQLYGRSPHAIFNAGLCHYHLRRMEAALACAGETLALLPEHDGARAMRVEIEAGLSAATVAGA